MVFRKIEVLMQCHENIRTNYDMPHSLLTLYNVSGIRIIVVVLWLAIKLGWKIWYISITIKKVRATIINVCMLLRNFDWAVAISCTLFYYSSLNAVTKEQLTRQRYLAGNARWRIYCVQLILCTILLLST